MNIREVFENEQNKKYLIFIFFALATTYFFSRIFFGLDFADTFFHLNQARSQSKGDNYFTFFLSSILINGIIKIFGSDLVYLRFFNALLIFLSVLIPYFFLRKKNSNKKFFFLVSCTLIFLTTLNANILGYDTLSVFFASLIFVFTIAYLRKNNIFLLFTISLLCAVNIFIRFPNIYLIPILTLVFYTEGFKSIQVNEFKRFRKALIFLFLTLVFTVLGYSFYFYEIGNFPDTILENKYHNPRILMENYFRDSLSLISYIIACLFFLQIFRKINKRRSNIKNLASYIILGIIASVLIIIFVLHSKYSLNFSLFLTGLSISFVILELRNNAIPRYVALLFMLLLFIIPFGSNTGLLKSSLLIVLLPFVLMYSNLERSKIFILLFLIPFSILESFLNIYEDKNVFALSHTPEIEELQFIRTSNIRSVYLENISQEVVELRKKEISVYFYGNKSHIFTYLHPHTSLGKGQFFQPLDNKEALDNLDKRKRTAIFIVDSYPDNNSDASESFMVRALIERNFKKVRNNELVYYLRK